MKGFKNFAKLKKAMIDKYGEGIHVQPIGSGPEFLWQWWGKKTFMSLVYKEEFGDAWLFIYTPEIEKQMDEYYKAQRNE